MANHHVVAVATLDHDKQGPFISNYWPSDFLWSKFESLQLPDLLTLLHSSLETEDWTCLFLHLRTSSARTVTSSTHAPDSHSDHGQNSTTDSSTAPTSTSDDLSRPSLLYGFVLSEKNLRIGSGKKVSTVSKSLMVVAHDPCFSFYLYVLRHSILLTSDLSEKRLVKAVYDMFNVPWSPGKLLQLPSLSTSIQSNFSSLPSSLSKYPHNSVISMLLAQDEISIINSSLSLIPSNSASNTASASSINTNALNSLTTSAPCNISPTSHPFKTFNIPPLEYSEDNFDFASLKYLVRRFGVSTMFIWYTLLFEQRLLFCGYPASLVTQCCLSAPLLVSPLVGFASIMTPHILPHDPSPLLKSSYICGTTDMAFEMRTNLYDVMASLSSGIIRTTHTSIGLPDKTFILNVLSGMSGNDEHWIRKQFYHYTLRFLDSISKNQFECPQHASMAKFFTRSVLYQRYLATVQNFIIENAMKITSTPCYKEADAQIDEIATTLLSHSSKPLPDLRVRQLLWKLQQLLVDLATIDAVYAYQVLPAIVPFLDSNSAQVRKYAVSNLAQIAMTMQGQLLLLHHDLVPRVVLMLRDPMPNVASAAVYCLYKISTLYVGVLILVQNRVPKMLLNLVFSRDDDNLTIKSWAAETLLQITRFDATIASRLQDIDSMCTLLKHSSDTCLSQVLYQLLDAWGDPRIPIRPDAIIEHLLSQLRGKSINHSSANLNSAKTDDDDQKRVLATCMLLTVLPHHPTLLFQLAAAGGIPLITANLQLGDRRRPLARSSLVLLCHLADTSIGRLGLIGCQAHIILLEELAHLEAPIYLYYVAHFLQVCLEHQDMVSVLVEAHVVAKLITTITQALSIESLLAVTLPCLGALQNIVITPDGSSTNASYLLQQYSFLSDELVPLYSLYQRLHPRLIDKHLDPCVSQVELDFFRLLETVVQLWLLIDVFYNIGELPSDEISKFSKSSLTCTSSLSSIKLPPMVSNRLLLPLPLNNLSKEMSGLSSNSLLYNDDISKLAHTGLSSSALSLSKSKRLKPSTNKFGHTASPLTSLSLFLPRKRLLPPSIRLVRPLVPSLSLLGNDSDAVNSLNFMSPTFFLPGYFTSKYLMPIDKILQDTSPVQSHAAYGSKNSTVSLLMRENEPQPSQGDIDHHVTFGELTTSSEYPNNPTLLISSAPSIIPTSLGLTLSKSKVTESQLADSLRLFTKQNLLQPSFTHKVQSSRDDYHFTFRKQPISPLTPITAYPSNSVINAEKSDTFQFHSTSTPLLLTSALRKSLVNRYSESLNKNTRNILNTAQPDIRCWQQLQALSNAIESHTMESDFHLNVKWNKMSQDAGHLLQWNLFRKSLCNGAEVSNTSLINSNLTQVESLWNIISADCTYLFWIFGLTDQITTSSSGSPVEPAQKSSATPVPQSSAQRVPTLRPTKHKSRQRSKSASNQFLSSVQKPQLRLAHLDVTPIKGPLDIPKSRVNLSSNKGTISSKTNVLIPTSLSSQKKKIKK